MTSTVATSPGPGRRIKPFFCPGFTGQPAAFESPSLSNRQNVRLRRPERPPVCFHPQAVRRSGGCVRASVEVGVAAPPLSPDAGMATALPVPQPDFDALLARSTCCWCAAKIPSSAQWAAKPMLWHIYPTDDARRPSSMPGSTTTARPAPLIADAYRASLPPLHGDRFAHPTTVSCSSYRRLASHAIRWRDTCCGRPTSPTASR